jgi:hypothetical protein
MNIQSKERIELSLKKREGIESHKMKILNDWNSEGTLLARELIAVAYANGATANAQGDAATISPNPR